jgi:hypothetical protein
MSEDTPTAESDETLVDAGDADGESSVPENDDGATAGSVEAESDIVVPDVAGDMVVEAGTAEAIVADRGSEPGVWDWELEGSGDTDDRSAQPDEVPEKMWGLPGWALAVVIVAIVGIIALIVGGLVRGNSVQSAPTTTFPSCSSALTTAARLAYNPHLTTPYLLGGVVAPATGSSSPQAAVVQIATNTKGLRAVCPYVTLGDMVGVMSTAWQHAKRAGGTFPMAINSVLQPAAPGTRFVVKSVTISKRSQFVATGTASVKTQKRTASGNWTTIGTTGSTYRLVELGGSWFVDATEGQSAVILLPAA